MRPRARSFALLGLAAAGCSGGASSPDSLPPGTYVPLITADWTLPPGSEMYLCATKTMTEDIYAGTLRAMAPFGTHHTTVSKNAGGGVDNPSFPCGPEFGNFWASGTGGDQPLILPDGVGLLAAKGQQLRLGLHLFNAGDTPISGTSGLEVIPLDPSEVVHFASVTFHGPFSFEIPPTGDPYSVSQRTTLGDRTLVAIFPHMHQLGEHFRVTLGDTMLWDQAYEFEKQEFVALPSIRAVGQVMETTCTWVNTTPSPVTWGDSSTAEMCFTVLMAY